MDLDSWRLQLMWKIPRSPRKKIRWFQNIGDRYRVAERPNRARLCYTLALDLARRIDAVTWEKRLRRRLRQLG